MVKINWSLALSGGGPRGAAHVGVLKALEENGLEPSSVTGTSAGSFVAGMVAEGFGADKMIKEVQFLADKGLMVIDPDIKGFIKSFPKIVMSKDISIEGILKGKKMENYFRKVFGDKYLKEVNMPLVICAVDILSGKTIALSNINKPQNKDITWYSNLKLYEAVRASCSLPGIFIPKEIGDMTLVDGGLTYNLPFELNFCFGTGKVIAVDLGEKYSPPFMPSIADTLSSSFKIMQLKLKKGTKRDDLLILRPPLNESANLFCFSCMNESMNIGYEYAIKNMTRIKTFLET